MTRGNGAEWGNGAPGHRGAFCESSRLTPIIPMVWVCRRVSAPPSRLSPLAAMGWVCRGTTPLRGGTTMCPTPWGRRRNISAPPTRWTA